MNCSYLVSGCRTPIGKYLGGLATSTAAQLGGAAIAEAVRRSNVDPNSINHVIMGQVIAAGAGQSPARQAATHAGLPTSIGAATINKVCGSGLFAIMLADMAIRAGEYQRVIAGGMESMSQAPHLLRNGRTGWKYGEQTLLDSNDVDGLRCAQLGLAMGCIAEWVASQAAITRDDQDSWAVRSHQLAINSGKALSAEIVPIQVMEAKKQVIRSSDEGPREDCTLEGLAKLKPVFASPLVQAGCGSNDPCSVTAGNASTLSDGAAAVVVVDESTVRELKSDVLFRIVAHSHFADDHQRIFTAPVNAIRRLLEKTHKSVSEIDLFEINEAFAAQTIACVQKLQLDVERVNVRGGAIALGHPLGCSGTRILVTLMHIMLAQEKRLGVAALCLGGGEAVAMMIERVS